MADLEPLPSFSALSNEQLIELWHGEYLAAAHCQHEPSELQAVRDSRVKLIEDEVCRRGTGYPLPADSAPQCPRCRTRTEIVGGFNAVDYVQCPACGYYADSWNDENGAHLEPADSESDE